MGITWKFTMVLLSTLAALVIIVHSAEEEYENQYRRALRPRALDTGTRRYEQPWRTLEVEPAMQQSTSRVELEDISSEEPPRRRRSGRKRKRRPEPVSAEEVSNERYAEDNSRHHFDDFSIERQTSEMPKRRRKKIERRLKWADSLEEDRPIRRRRQRRKRPSKEPRSELSEFNDYHPKQASRFTDEEFTTDQVMTMNEKKHGDDFGSTRHLTEKLSDDFIESREVFGTDGRQQRANKNSNDHSNEAEEIYRSIEKIDGSSVTASEKDKSLSEFSLESLPGVNPKSTEEGGKAQEKYLKRQKTDPLRILSQIESSIIDMGTNYLPEHSKVQVSPIDPLTLKDILKKSNGTSLSEILQQHNLSLTDLLHGKELALSILKSENILQNPPSTKTRLSENSTAKKPIQVNSEEKESSEEKLLIHSETKYVTDPTTETPMTTLVTQTDQDDITTVEIAETTTTTEEPKEEKSIKPTIVHRFPTGIRRKQRIRPVISNNYKSQLNRDMLALTARKYYNNNSRRRNVTKSQEWRDVIPLMKNVTEILSEKPQSLLETTTFNTDIEITTIYEETNAATTISVEESNIINDTSHEVLEKEASQNGTQVAKADEFNKPIINEIEKPKSIPPLSQVENSSGLRRQAFNNILKKKRRKQKYSTTDAPAQDDFMKNLFGMPNLVSSSEFIARTQSPKTSLDDVTILEDFLTTEMPNNFEDKPSKVENKPKYHENKPRKLRYSTRSPTTYIYRQTYIPSSTEESAKIEIEEILNDTRANARLSKILMERNMTLSELVEHRERGSSYVHLADIFHNASKEPNPPEPFLSKSAIEPISKETYPLRALLDAHDTTTTTTTTIDPVQDDYIRIPIKMDFGHNVNEHAENMGIMSLFQNITKTDTKADANTLMKDSQGTPYSASIIVVNTTDDHKDGETARESKVMHSLNETPDDVVGWNEIFNIMRQNYENTTKELTGLMPAESIKKPSSEEDLDGDGLIVLEDLQRLNEFSSKISSDEKLDVSSSEKAEAPTNLPAVPDKTPNQTISTRSVTLATASIVGLAMVLFLLTYIGYRWRQQRVFIDKNNFPDERIPSPVFENRKGHKHNSSNRSISPMLSSNIYTLSTLDSQNGKESPDYMWDSLRKPFQ